MKSTTILHKLRLAFVGSLLFMACADEEPFGDTVTNINGPYIELTFTTRAEDDTNGNTSPFNAAEQTMNTVDLFFYRNQGENMETAAPVRVCSFVNKKHDDKVQISIAKTELASLFGSGSEEDGGTCFAYAVVNVSEDDYKAANIDKNTASIADLRQIKASTPTFATQFDGFAMFTLEQDGKGDVVTYDATARKATGTIHVKNFAAKIDLFVNFGNIEGGWEVVKNEDKPTAEVHILNGVQTVWFSGFNKENLTDDDYYSIRTDADDDYRRGMAAVSTKSDGGYSWCTASPYYTYPNQWDISPLEQHRTTLLLKVDWTQNQTDLETPPLTTYYSVPLNLEGNQLESNKYYRVKVNINTLGGQNFGEPLVLEDCSWEVLDWGHAELEADIREIRYLEIARKVMGTDGLEYAAILNNAEMTIIPYYTSHGVKIKEATITYYDIYNASEEGAIPMKTPNNQPIQDIGAFTLASEPTQAEIKEGIVGAYIDPISHTVSVYHPLYTVKKDGNRYLSDGKDTYSPYLIEITLQHVDDPNTTAVIKIKQYPAVYAENSFNPGNAPTGGWSNWVGTNYGYVLVNGNRNNFGGVNGIATGRFSQLVENGIFSYSSNPNMYVITVTNLNVSDAPLHLGDPRTKHIQTNLETTNRTIDRAFLGVTLKTNDPLSLSDVDEGLAGWTTDASEWKNGSLTDGVLRKLTYYYPTDETETEEAKYMLAPQFRISSSYGTHNTAITRNNARKRCATYQESGYPAGRWRLPTVGELQYIAILSQKGIVPPLFSTNRAYWSSHGAYKIERNQFVYITELENILDWLQSLFGGSDVTGYTRCVYDEWYWKYKDNEGNVIPDKLPDNLVNGTSFYWGDKPKDNPQTQPER